MKFNTAIAALMKLLNVFTDAGSISRKDFKTYLILLNPIAPHITEELWESCGFGGMLSAQKWPEYDESKTVEATLEIPGQINGKVRAKLTVSPDAGEAEVKELAHQSEAVKALLEGKNVVKEIYVKGRIFNIVVK